MPMQGAVPPMPPRGGIEEGPPGGAQPPPAPEGELDQFGDELMQYDELLRIIEEAEARLAHLKQMQAEMEAQGEGGGGMDQVPVGHEQPQQPGGLDQWRDAYQDRM